MREGGREGESVYRKIQFVFSFLSQKSMQPKNEYPVHFIHGEVSLLLLKINPVMIKILVRYWECGRRIKCVLTILSHNLMQTIVYRKIQCVIKNALDFMIKIKNALHLAME